MKILRAGPQTTVQDTGRIGHGALGIGSAGALDPFSARIANLLVGNDEADALLEIALGNFRLQFTDERVIAWSGGDFQVRVSGVEVKRGHVCRVETADEITFESAKLGCRAWLAFSGGIDVPVVLDSRSTDLRAGFGGFDGRALRDGDEIPLRDMTPASLARVKSLRSSRVSSWSASSDWVETTEAYPTLRFIRGTDWNLFDEAAQRALTSEKFTVAMEADRMGVRLDGAELKRREERDLLSEAVAPGTMQVPPSGKPILLLGDCQTIGGYPKIAHVITVDLPIAAQLRPGDEVRFRETSVARAQSFLLQRMRDLQRFRVGLVLKTS